MSINVYMYNIVESSKSYFAVNCSDSKFVEPAMESKVGIVNCKKNFYRVPCSLIIFAQMFDSGSQSLRVN